MGKEMWEEDSGTGAKHFLRCFTPCGGKGIRTPDIQLAKLALYQLSYTPEKFGTCLRGSWPLVNNQPAGG